MTEEKNNTTLPGADPLDSDSRCGWWIFSLPQSDPLSFACRNHDAAYLQHHQGYQGMTQDEADNRLRSALKLLAENEIYPEHGTGFAQWWESMRAEVLGILGTSLGGLFWKANNTSAETPTEPAKPEEPGLVGPLHDPRQFRDLAKKVGLVEDYLSDNPMYVRPKK